MEIHLSEKFSEIEVINHENESITIQCGLWPSWNDMYQNVINHLSSAQLDQIQTLYRAEDVSREFEIENGILKIRFGQAAVI